MIDWTLPVETTEDPPRPVRVLCTDLESERYPVVYVVFGTSNTPCVRSATAEGHDVINQVCLRNVAPPKPEPVLREAWLNLSDNGAVWTYINPEAAERAAEQDRVECRRIAWMSDGSPVPSEASGEVSDVAPD